MGSYEFRCGCGYVSHDIDDDDHTPEPGDCCNCGGRKCMGCVMRDWEHHCADDCPFCCVQAG